MTVNDFKNWLEGYLVGCNNNFDYNVINNKLYEVNEGYHRKRAFLYLVWPLLVKIQ